MKRLALWLVSLLASLICLVPLAQAQTASDYTQGVEVSGSTAKFWFRPTSTQTTWADVHYQLNGGPVQSLRMTFNAATGRHEQNVLSPVAAGNTLSYRFTYNKGAPAYDTPTFAFTVGSGGGGTAATPTFSPAPGTYTGTQNVTLATSTAGAQIRYTTDGSTPTATSALYGGAISVAATTTIKAIATASGMTNSAVATGLFTINPGGGFSFTQGVDAAGTTATIWFKPGQTITFVDVHYQVNGGAQQNLRMTNNAGAARFETAVSNVAAGQVISYWFTYSLTGASTVDTGVFSFTMGSGGGTVATPAFAPAGGTYAGAQNVTITSATVRRDDQVHAGRQHAHRGVGHLHRPDRGHHQPHAEGDGHQDRHDQLGRRHRRLHDRRRRHGRHADLHAGAAAPTPARRTWRSPAPPPARRSSTRRTAARRPRHRPPTPARSR